MTDAKLEVLLSAKNTADAAFKRMEGQIRGVANAANMLKGAFAGALAGITVAGTVTALNRLTGVAGDVQESISKVGTLFGGQLSRDMARWANDAATAMGLSKQAALDAAGEIGNMYLQLGAGREQSAALSKEMVQLSADIASFSNVSGGAKQVMDAMSSAFRGEYDSLQRYIPTINAAAVQQEALASSGKKSAGELSNLEKAMAVYNIITRDAGLAVGDFNRTSDSLANTTRRLDAEWQNFAATLGEKFMDSASKIKSLTADIVRNLREAIQGPALEAQLAAARAEYARLTNLQEYKAREAEERANKFRQRMEQFERDQMKEYSNNLKYADQGLFGGPNRVDPLESQLDRDIKKAKELLDSLEQIYVQRTFESAFTDAYSFPAPAPTINPGNAVVPDLLDARYPTPPPFATAYGSSAAAWVLTTGPDSDAERAYREIQEMIDRRNKMFEVGNQALVDLTQHTAELMQENFSDLFYDAITGQLNSFRDYLDGIFKSIARGWSDLMGKMASEFLFKNVLSGLFQGGGSLGSNSSTGALLNWGAKGLVFDQNSVKWHAAGDILSAPTVFPLRDGSWVGGGEAGYEAIMPLRRGADGRLGVEAGGGGGMTVNIYNSTGAEVRTERREGRAGIELDVFIDKLQAKNLAQMGSASNRVLRQLGASPPLIQR